MKILNKLNYIFDKKQKVQIIILLIMIFVGGFLELIGVSAILPVVELILQPERMQENQYISYLYRFLPVDNYSDFLCLMIILMIAVYIFKGVYLYGLYYIQNTFTYLNQKKLSTKLLDIYLRQPYSFHLNNNSAELIRNINADVPTFYRLVMNVLLLATDGITAIMLLILLFLTDAMMTISIVLVGLTFLGIYLGIVRKQIRKYGQKFRLHNAKLTQWLQQALGGIKETKILKKEDFFCYNYGINCEQYAKSYANYYAVSSFPKYFLEAICITAILIVMLLKIKSGNGVQAIIPQLAVFAVAAFRLIPSMNKITAAMGEIMFASPSLDLIYHDIKEMDTMKKDMEGIKRNSQVFLEKLSFHNSIEVEHVSFRYENSDKDVLNHVSITIPKNKSVAFIGQSGAGKTTMADIILGLLQPNEGRVCVDGVDIKSNYEAWLDKVSYIPQAIYLCDDTIKHNIAFGISDNEVDEDRLNRVIEEAQLQELIENQPEGVNTYIGENGMRISGGQRQRIGIARALYSRPEILILDEATSALDTETEQAVMDAINGLQGKITLIIIAHRLSTTEKCDYVYKIIDGKAVIWRQNEERK